MAVAMSHTHHSEQEQMVPQQRKAIDKPGRQGFPYSIGCRNIAGTLSSNRAEAYFTEHYEYSSSVSWLMRKLHKYRQMYITTPQLQMSIDTCSILERLVCI